MIHLRRLVGATAALILWQGNAFAAPDALFHSTITFTQPDGAAGAVKANADGTYTATIGGKPVKGKWTDKGKSTCFLGDGEIKEHCAVYPADIKVGDTVMDTDGVKMTISPR